MMITRRNYLIQQLLFCSIIFLLLFSFSIKLTAEQIHWIEVSKNNNELVLIDPNSINYNNRGILSVITKYSKINPENDEILNSDPFLIAIDCDNRLFSKLPLNAKIKQVKNWKNSTNNSLIKKTIINSCSY